MIENCGACVHCVDAVTPEARADSFGFPPSSMRMVVCAECGNKRCPRAACHLLDCTGSNEVGQPGSYYAGARIQPAHIHETRLTIEDRLRIYEKALTYIATPTLDADLAVTVSRLSQMAQRALAGDGTAVGERG